MDGVIHGSNTNQPTLHQSHYIKMNDVKITRRNTVQVDTVNFVVIEVKAPFVSPYSMTERMDRIRRKPPTKIWHVPTTDKRL
jgi:hypothetical protein